MKKDINEILKAITPETPIEEVIAYCDTVEDFNLILSKLPHTENKPVPLSDELKKAAFSLVKTNKLNAAEITTSFIQKNLTVTYPQAAALVDWLKNRLLCQ